MSVRFLVIVLVACVVSEGSEFAGRDDPVDLHWWFRTVFEECWSTWAVQGIPEIGIPSFDPLIIRRGDLRDLGLEGIIVNTTVWNLINAVLDDVNVDAASQTVDLKLSWKDVRVEGHRQDRFRFDIDEASLRVQLSFTYEEEFVIISDVRLDVHADDFDTLLRPIVDANTHHFIDTLNDILRSSTEGIFGIPVNGVTDLYIAKDIFDLLKYDGMPLYLPEDMYDVKAKVGDQLDTVTLSFEKGEVYGVAELRRTGDCFMRFYGKHYLELLIAAGVSVFHFQYDDVELTNANLTLNGFLDATVTDVELLIDVLLYTEDFPFRDGGVGEVVSVDTVRIGLIDREIVFPDAPFRIDYPDMSFVEDLVADGLRTALVSSLDNTLDSLET